MAGIEPAAYGVRRQGRRTERRGFSGGFRRRALGRSGSSRIGGNPRDGVENGSVDLVARDLLATVAAALLRIVISMDGR
jgi:hypothetical protein